MPQPCDLPGTSTDLWDWQIAGACRGEDSSVFFHPDGERGRERIERERRAKEICSVCPVLESCREYSLRVGEPYGVWGGLSESERALLLRAHRRTQ